MTAELQPVAEDMSAFIIAGQVSSEADRYERETEGRTPAQGVQDGVDAEQLGFRRVWLSERWDIKQADVILSAVGAKTTRLEIGTGIVVPSTRHAWSAASLGATFHAVHGERFILGLGRGEKDAFKGMGIKVTTFEAMADYVDIYRRLWAGEAVNYDGPAGKFSHLAFADTYVGKQPEIWLAGYAHAMGAECLVKAGFNGIILPPVVTPVMVAAAKERIRVACDRFDRDPGEIRVVVPVVTAPNMDEVEAMSISAGRLVTYLQYPYYGDALATANGWDLGPVNEMRNHEQFKGLVRAADLTFHRHEMLGPASVLPREWIHDSCAIGTVDECVKNLQRFIDAGADEIATYGSTPRQNAELVAAWRDRKKR
ncbi:TIGR03857 family LLM class F420-dependent oxidoreductase [Mycobacterium sp. pUA109]|uniref:TIGR03857 family LLM class F420-dependent oxidoreductase n=1 Tax=Mycobacterium sp. pUA109 TaxID=3238982 RepID=UPI00351B8E43